MKKNITAWFYIFLFIIFCIKLIIIILTFTWKYSITNEFEMLWSKSIIIILIKFMQNDLIVFSSFILISLLINISSHKLFRLLIRFLLFFLIWFYIFDLWLIYFSTRLFIVDIPKFIFDIPDKRMIYSIIVGIAIVFLTYYLCKKINIVLKVKYLVYISIFFVLFYFVPINISANYLKEWLFSKNMYQLNLDLSYLKSYSKYREYSNDYINLHKNFTWSKSEKNVILLVVESLSCVDSQRCSNIQNYMPKYDQIQKDGITYKNFFASANTTDWWLINILEWVETLPYTVNTDYYNTFYSVENSLPYFFNSIWYSSTFITTWPLDFLWKWNFLKKVWFQKIIWWDSFTWEKYTFWSVPDESLYNKSLEEIKNKINLNEKFFIGMLTISSHLTYNTPYWISKEQMYRYVDEKLYNFYSELQKTKFFDNWILIIIWDHRKMTPLEQWEYEQYQNSAYGRISATIIWSWIEKDQVDENVYQQTDLYHSIKKLFAKWNTKLIGNYNDIFANTINRNFVITPMFSDKNNIIITKKNSVSLVKLDGDETRFIDWDSDFWVLDYISKLRSYQFYIKNN